MRIYGRTCGEVFPMGGEKSLPELYALATAAARHGMTLIEPTGGISHWIFRYYPANLPEAGVPRTSCRMFTARYRSQTGNTRPKTSFG